MTDEVTLALLARDERIAELELVLEGMREKLLLAHDRADSLDADCAMLRGLLAKAVPAVPEQFKSWFLSEVPEGTIIGNPGWWADRIAKRFMTAPAPVQADVPLINEGKTDVPQLPNADDSEGGHCD